MEAEYSGEYDGETRSQKCCSLSNDCNQEPLTTFNPRKNNLSPTKIGPKKNV